MSVISIIWDYFKILSYPHFFPLHDKWVSGRCTVAFRGSSLYLLLPLDLSHSSSSIPWRIACLSWASSVTSSTVTPWVIGSCPHCPHWSAWDPAMAVVLTPTCTSSRQTWSPRLLQVLSLWGLSWLTSWAHLYSIILYHCGSGDTGKAVDTQRYRWLTSTVELSTLERTDIFIHCCTFKTKLKGGQCKCSPCKLFGFSSNSPPYALV